VPLRVRVPVERTAELLARFKDEHDTAPRSARLDVERRIATPHALGRYVDVYATAEALERAANAPSEGDAVVVASLAPPPRATSEAVLAIRTDRVLARYETRFGTVGKQAGRARNVARAAAGMDGVVLMPGEVVSFNENVGPRVEDNGFTLAPEIYKGEMREGVGGGTCQVAGTLHAAAFFGGLEIVERASHSRPSGYIPMGLDATVVYPYVDLKLRNPFEFPVVVRARVGDGVLAFELVGRDRPAEVELATEVLGTAAYKRKVEETARVAPGSFRLKQKGIRGTTLRKIRRLKLREGSERVETSVDVYPPTFEIYEIAPGDDPAAVLPPPPEDPKAAGEVYAG
jgi:vancomycin resistance protein YoaR